VTCRQLATLSERQIHLFYGARTSSDLCIDEAFDGDPPLVRDRVRAVPAISKAETDGSWTGERGLIHEVVRRWLKGAEASLSYDYYFCGPPQMSDAVRSLLQLEFRVPAVQLHADSIV